MGRTTALRQAIKTRFVPLMTGKGFAVDQSRMPQSLTFRKITPEKIYVCDIQWEKYGRPRFIVNFGLCGPRGTVCHGHDIDPAQIFPELAPANGRLAPGRGAGSSSWFRQDRTLLGWLFARSRMKPPEEAADELSRLFAEVENYWSDGTVGPHIRLRPPAPEHWVKDR